MSRWSHPQGLTRHHRSERQITSWADAGSGPTDDVRVMYWAAAGLKDTLLRCEVKPEVVYGNEKAVQPRVQA